MTLHILSKRPETFGQIRTSLDTEARLERLNSLLTAAKAYAIYHGKHHPFPRMTFDAAWHAAIVADTCAGG
jgi:hypothetical protein